MRVLGEMFQDIVRPSDHVARYGGDEFAILLGSVTLDTAIQVAQRIRSRVESSNFDAALKYNYVSVTLSMGLAVCRLEDTPETLIEKADAALYRSKQSGRNRLSLYVDETRTTRIEDDYSELDAEVKEMLQPQA